MLLPRPDFLRGWQPTPETNSSGEFNWQCRIGKKINVYDSNKKDLVKSNRVVVAAKLFKLAGRIETRTAARLGAEVLPGSGAWPPVDTSATMEE
jgi:hypothetical protein